MNIAGKSAVFLDRDGVINKKAPEGDYIRRPAELLLLPEVGQAISQLNSMGFFVCITTNQRGVALGLMGIKDLVYIHNLMLDRLEYFGARIDGIFSCPHNSSEHCDCRKPSPGMLWRAQAMFGLDLKKSWMIGDRLSDILTGQSVGCRTILVDPLSQLRDDLCWVKPDSIVDDLPQAIKTIILYKE